MRMFKKVICLYLLVIIFLFGGCNSTNAENKNLTDNKAQAEKPNINSQVKANEGTKISEVNTTWKGFLDTYMKENPDISGFNPNHEIANDRKVKVVKTEYHDGYNGKAGAYSYALITEVYDENTGQLLSSAGTYKTKN